MKQVFSLNVFFDNSLIRRLAAKNNFLYRPNRTIIIGINPYLNSKESENQEIGFWVIE